MAIALDANVLVFRTNRASAHYERACEVVDALVGAEELVYLFWPTIVAYLRVVTVRGALQPPLSIEAAMENIGALLGSGNFRAAGERPGFWNRLTEAALSADAHGKLIHDAHLVALMRQHGVGTIWTNDRDFARFPGIHVVDPFA
jgi:toxin-antitoxin system PIN domain toxin